jgi:hypothetical protein
MTAPDHARPPEAPAPNPPGAVAGGGAGGGAGGAGRSGEDDGAAPVVFGLGRDPAALRIRPAQGVVLVVLAVAILGVIAFGVVRGEASSSAHPDVLGGSVVVAQTGHHPIVVDVARGKATSRLVGLGKAVGADGDPDSVGYGPTTVGTFLFNTRTGAYNLLGKDNLVVLRTGGGIALPAAPDAAAGATITGVPTDDALFLVRRTAGGAGATQAWLVDRDTVRSGATGETVTPRAAAELPDATVGTRSATAVHHGSLWVVADGTERRLVRMSLDADPRSKAMVVERTDPLAIGGNVVVAAGGDVVAAASPGSTNAFVVTAPVGAAASARLGAVTEVALPGLAAASAVVPVRGADGAWFALRSPAGWSLAGVDGAGAAVGPIAIPDSTATAMVAEPYAIGRVVVVAGTDGSITRVDLDRATATRVEGAGAYPVDPAENPDAQFFQDIVVTTQAQWFVVNAPQALHSVVVPAAVGPASVVDKSGAQDVDPAAPPSPSVQAQDKGATDPNNPNAPTTLPGAPPEAAVREATPEQITEEHACENLNQKPRKPQIVSLEPTKDSMTVSWSYVKLDPGDCQPSSYLIEAHAADGGEDPSPAVQAHTNAETQFLFTGLRPNHTYEITVTAVIGQNRTASDPVKRRTDNAGPDAPRTVTASADSPGGWTVTWTACDGSACAVPVASWQVSWSLCGGGYLGEQAPVANLPASTRSLAVTLAAHPDLVGRSLSFTVTALSEQGQRAALTDSSCTEGWREPDVSKVVVDVGARIVDGSSVEAAVSIATTPDKTATFGTSNPQFTYRIDDRTVGPTADLQGVVRGLAPGLERTVTVTVSSHGVSRTTEPKILPAAFLDWPAVSASATVTPSPADPNIGTVTVTVAQVPTDPLSAHVELNCAGLRLAHDGQLDGGTIAWDVDLVDGLGPDCAAKVTIRQTAATPRYSPTAIPDISAGTLHLDPLGPPPVTSRWEVATVPVNGVPTEVVKVRIGGQVPVIGREWRLLPSGPCELPRFDWLPGQPLDFTLDESCVGPDARFDVVWRYLATTSTQTFVVPGDRPVITTPTTLPTTTTIPETTTTTSVLPTVPLPPLRAAPAASPTAPITDGRMPATNDTGPLPLRVPMVVFPTVLILAVVRRRRQEPPR